MTGTGPVRVLHFTWRLSPSGGIPRVVRDLASGIGPLGVDLHLVSARPRLVEDELEGMDRGATLHFLGITGSGRRARAAAAARLGVVLRRVEPHVVHLHSGTASYALVPVALWARGVARVLEVHDAPGHGRHSRTTELVEHAMVRRFGYRPLVHSSSVAAAVAGTWGVGPETVAVVPLGIDVDGFAGRGPARERWRQSHEIDPGATVALYVARLVPSKNVDLYLDVARRVSGEVEGVVFVLAGGGPELPAIRQRAEHLGLGGRLKILGPVASVLDAYSGADVFVSTSDSEGFGLAVLEAMAAARPVVATAVGGITDLVEHPTTGLLTAPGDAAALAGGLVALASDPELRRRMGRAGRERARRLFGLDTMLGAYGAFYTRLVRDTTAR